MTHMANGGPALRGDERRSVMADGREGAGQLVSRPRELCEGSRDGRSGAGAWTHPRRQALWHNLSACAVQPAIVLVVLLLLLHGPSCVLSVWPICYDHYVPDKIGTDAGACISRFNAAAACKTERMPARLPVSICPSNALSHKLVARA